MFDFFKSLFRKETSSATAKERLRLVLLSDHLSLAPDVIEALKTDLLALISRYVEIDAAHADVSFEQREREVAMLASIPIVGMLDRRDSQPPTTSEPPMLVSVPPAAAQPVAAGPETPAEAAPQPAAGVPPPPRRQPKANGSPRRRRRRKPSASNGPPPSLGAPVLGNPAQA